MNGKYELPTLTFDYKALEPVMSEVQLRLHHDKHHQAYVDKANELLAILVEAREKGDSADFGAIAKKLSFNVGGHLLHTLFWESLAKPEEGNKPEGDIAQQIENDFGSLERFQAEFLELAITIEGSGWAALTYSKETGRLQLLQIGNHNLNIVPNQIVVMALDMWEHAYYIDYKNDKKSFAQNFWKIISWPVVNRRLENAKK